MIPNSMTSARPEVVSSAAASRIDSGAAWSVGIVAFGLFAWVVMLVVMADMDHGPGTPLHDFPTFLIGWVTMLTAMMLPSEVLYVRVFATLLKVGAKDAPEGRGRFLLVTLFIAGYGLAWLAYGVIAFVLDAIVRVCAFEFFAWDKGGPLLAGSVLLLAGIYQVSPLKTACLTHCRSPLSFFTRNWRTGCFGSLHMGLSHGLVCVTCCWALMAVMFAVGVMNLIWMGLLTIIMFAEKVLPLWNRLSALLAISLFATGIWIAVAPDSTPFLKNPLKYSRSGHGHAKGWFSVGASEESARHPLIGLRAPEFSLLDIDGRQVSLSELNQNGPVVVVFYYGYWCSHCVAQLFALNEDIKRFEELATSVVAVSPDSPNDTAEKFGKYGRFDFPVLSDAKHIAAAAYDVYAARTEDFKHGTFLIDRNGIVVWANTGGAPFTEFEALLEVVRSLDN